ncbi:MAG: beta-glucuronidase [Solirubrobacteraceae bacterium]|jgi:beta-glucuronidase|nr:beta-glucuronidase [Solirubrobacteraceae bacterium]
MPLLLSPARSLAITVLLGLAVAVFPATAAAAPRAHAAAAAPRARAAAAAPQAHAAGAVTPKRGALTTDGWTNRYLLDGSWLYRADSSGSGVARGFWRDRAGAAGWSPVGVPNSYNAASVSTSSFYGTVGWYRKDFHVPSGPAGEQWIVRFESVNYRAQIWLNGRPVGSHVGAFIPFELSLTGLRPHAVNHLVVRVENHLGPADLPLGPYGSGGTPSVGGWWNYGGLLGDVYLRPVREANLEQVIVRPQLPCPTCTATIVEQALVHNVTRAPQRVRLRGSYGGRPVNFGSTTIAPGATWSAHATVRVAHPRLWAPGSPALYHATVTLTGAGGQQLAGFVTDSGIKLIKVVSGGLLELNGHPLHLRGVGLQEMDVHSGAAMSSAQIERLIGWVRALGADLIRLQYPANPLLEELADRYGILLWSEIPVYQVKPKYLAQARTVALAHTMLTDNILDNESHPSIMLWSIGNELATPADASETSYIAGAAKLAHQLDPTRPVGMAVMGWPGVPCQPAYAPLDVIGLNEYFGWYDENEGSTVDRSALGSYLDFFRSCYPHQAMFVSEFGFEANRTGPVEEYGTYAFQSDAIAYHLAAFAQRPWLAGAIYWALQDFVCRPLWAGGNPLPDPPFFHKGLVDLQGNVKPTFAGVQRALRATVQVGGPPVPAYPIAAR